MNLISYNNDLYHQVWTLYSNNCGNSAKNIFQLFHQPGEIRSFKKSILYIYIYIYTYYISTAKPPIFPKQIQPLFDRRKPQTGGYGFPIHIGTPLCPMWEVVGPKEDHGSNIPIQVIQKVTLLSASWRSLNPFKGSLNHPKKVTLNHQDFETSSEMPDDPSLRFKFWWNPQGPTEGVSWTQAFWLNFICFLFFRFLLSHKRWCCFFHIPTNNRVGMQ